MTKKPEPQKPVDTFTPNPQPTLVPKANAKLEFIQALVHGFKVVNANGGHA